MKTCSRCAVSRPVERYIDSSDVCLYCRRAEASRPQPRKVIAVPAPAPPAPVPIPAAPLPSLSLANGCEIRQGDCRELMAAMPEASVDAIVTDPPYGLSFMGREWDHGVPGIPFWTEALRVLKPGGHLVAFGGTRTYHRLTCAIEDAGFEIRDCLMWLYGCLTADAEILTVNGWRRGVDVVEGDTVAAWNSATGRIVLEPVQRKTLAPWKGPLVKFVNDDTDQLLTPGHRVYHRPSKRQMTEGVRRRWYEEAYEVAEASAISRSNPVKLPVAGIHDGPGVGGVSYAALLGWVWTEGGFDSAPSRGVRIYQSESANPRKVSEIDDLVSSLVPSRKRYDRERVYRYKDTERPYTETCWFFTGDVAERLRSDLPGKHPTWELLWRMTSDEKQAFWDAAMKGDGCGDDFYQKNATDLEWAQALVATIGMRGKISMRKSPRDGGSLCVTPRDTTELQARHLRDATEHYEGDVWCVTVPSGAFVARRKGKVFITGNSGFPKSRNISKDMDLVVPAAPGRRAVSRRDLVPAEKDMLSEWHVQNGYRKDQGSLHRAAVGEHTTTSAEPATDAAREWQGWGTSLKPSYEPCILARKPLIGTVSANVLEHGTGALNIDGCRVAAEGGSPAAARRASARKSGNAPVSDRLAAQAQADGKIERRGSPDVYMAERESEALGRWPANLVLTHSVECVSVGTKRVKNTSGSITGNEASKPATGDAVYAERDRVPFSKHGDADGLETVEAWECAEGCPIKMLDQRNRDGEVHNKILGAHRKPARPDVGFGGGGGASRFFYHAKVSPKERAGSTHPTMKPVALMRWLVRLVTPPGGIVLDPFCGSGSTGVAAREEGFQFLGLELDPSYVEIARKRCGEEP